MPPRRIPCFCAPAAAGAARAGSRHTLCGRRVALPAARAAARASARLPVVCFDVGAGRDGDRYGDDGDDGDYDPEEEFAGFESVVLTDRETARTLGCVVEHEVDVGGVAYLVCAPKDDVVSFATEQDDVLVCIEDEEQQEALFATARAVMAEQRVKLKHSAFVLTMDETDAMILERSGLREDDDEDDEDDDDDEEEYGQAGDVDSEEDGDGEDVEVVGEFCHDGRYYLVVRPDNPVLLVARRTGETDADLVVPDDDELDRITPAIEAHLEALDIAL